MIKWTQSKMTDPVCCRKNYVQPQIFDEMGLSTHYELCWGTEVLRQTDGVWIPVVLNMHAHRKMRHHAQSLTRHMALILKLLQHWGQSREHMGFLPCRIKGSSCEVCHQILWTAIHGLMWPWCTKLILTTITKYVTIKHKCIIFHNWIVIDY